MFWRNVKVMGAISSALIALSFLPKIGFILPLIGFPMLFYTLKKISDRYDVNAFKDFLIGQMTQFAAVALLIAGILVSFAPYMIAVIKGYRHPSFLSILPQIGGLILIFYVLNALGAYMIKRAFDTLAELTMVDVFLWVGRLILAGALLSIVFIGFLLTWVSWVLAFVAFISIDEKVLESAGGKPPAPFH